MGSVKDFGKLLQDVVVETVHDCKVELGEGGNVREVVLPTVVRARRRLPGQLPPHILPVCFGRWDMNRKVHTLLKVQEEMTLSLVPPSQSTILLDTLELWRYTLASFIVHLGSLHDGHYIAYYRAGKAWLMVDNDVTQVVRNADAMMAARQAYLLIYRPDG